MKFGNLRAANSFTEFIWGGGGLVGPEYLTGFVVALYTCMRYVWSETHRWVFF